MGDSKVRLWGTFAQGTISPMENASSCVHRRFPAPDGQESGEKSAARLTRLRSRHVKMYSDIGLERFVGSTQFKPNWKSWLMYLTT